MRARERREGQRIMRRLQHIQLTGQPFTPEKQNHYGNVLLKKQQILGSFRGKIFNPNTSSLIAHNRIIVLVLGPQCWDHWVNRKMDNMKWSLNALICLCGWAAETVKAIRQDMDQNKQ